MKSFKEQVNERDKRMIPIDIDISKTIYCPNCYNDKLDNITAIVSITAWSKVNAIWCDDEEEGYKADIDTPDDLIEEDEENRVYLCNECDYHFDLTELEDQGLLHRKKRQHENRAS